jgi:carboxypeptidase Taq
MERMTPEAAYGKLMDATRETALLDSCAELLGWDEDTFMPPGGVAHRGRQMALLAGLLHDRWTDPRLGDWLAAIEGSSLVADPLSAEAVNVRELRRAYDRERRLPRLLVEEMAEVTSLAQQEWAIARRRSDFARFRPWLERIVALKRREVEARGWTTDAYDALLADYEPGARTAPLAQLFTALRTELAPLLADIAGARRLPNVAVLSRRYPLQRQRSFAQKVAAAVGFDFGGGRLDSTTHPFFASIGPGDVRITTRYTLNRFGEAFFATLHEVGHGLYEQGLPAEHHGTPMGEPPSLGMHESQARLWENAVGRSRGFWQHFFPLARQMFPTALRDVAADEFCFAVHHVAPSLNRVRADEVTYNLHILIRFELERALIHDELRPADLPAAWSEAYRHYLGIVPDDDADGCLQDGHWASGMFGYFPTYTLGNVFAAQLTARAAEELGDLDELFVRGELVALRDWLRDRIYREGGRRPAAQLIEHVTGSPPDHRPLVAALRRTYGEWYGVA